MSRNALIRPVWEVCLKRGATLPQTTAPARRIPAVVQQRRFETTATFPSSSDPPAANPFPSASEPTTTRFTPSSIQTSPEPPIGKHRLLKIQKQMEAMDKGARNKWDPAIRVWLETVYRLSVLSDKRDNREEYYQTVLITSEDFEREVRQQKSLGRGRDEELVFSTMQFRDKVNEALPESEPRVMAVEVPCKGGKKSNINILTNRPFSSAISDNLWFWKKFVPSGTVEDIVSETSDKVEKLIVGIPPQKWSNKDLSRIFQDPPKREIIYHDNGTIEQPKIRTPDPKFLPRPSVLVRELKKENPHLNFNKDLQSKTLGEKAVVIFLNKKPGMPVPETVFGLGRPLPVMKYTPELAGAWYLKKAEEVEEVKETEKAAEVEEVKEETA